MTGKDTQAAVRGIAGDRSNGRKLRALIAEVERVARTMMKCDGPPRPCARCDLLEAVREARKP